jgi:uncharacterized membrane protein
MVEASAQGSPAMTSTIAPTLLTAPAPQSAAPTPEPEPRRPRGEGSALAWGLAAVLFAVYAALAVRDQQRMLTTGFDLGIFDETVRGYAQGHLPMVALKGPHSDELGDHFSPIWAVLVPPYRLFPTAYTLLLAQAALFALGVVPPARWAAREVGRAAAVVVGLGYGLSWGIAAAAGFDVHEVAFAVPMLAYSATALGRRRWRAAAAWGLPLLLVKEDLGLTLAAIGLYIALHGARRLGAATFAAGVVGTFLEIKVLIPAFNGGRYAYTGELRSAFQGGLPQAMLRFITPETKLVTVVLMLAVTGFLALRSPIALLTVPTLAWRFLSDNPAYWGTDFHYSAVLMPIVFAAFVDALVRLNAQPHPLNTAVRRNALTVSAIVIAAMLPNTSLWTLTRASTWHTDPRVAVAHQVMGLIPDNVTVAADDNLAPQLTSRDTVSLLDDATPVRHPVWVLIDTENPDAFPMISGQLTRIISTLTNDGYHTVADRSGYLLLKY